MTMRMNRFWTGSTGDVPEMVGHLYVCAWIRKRGSGRKRENARGGWESQGEKERRDREIGEKRGKTGAD